MDKRFFEDHERKFKQIIVICDVYARKAEFYKFLYKLTGLKWAKKMNKYYYEEGMKLAIGGLGVALCDIAILDAYIKDCGE